MQMPPLHSLSGLVVPKVVISSIELPSQSLYTQYPNEVLNTSATRLGEQLEIVEVTVHAQNVITHLLFPNCLRFSCSLIFPQLLMHTVGTSQYCYLSVQLECVSNFTLDSWCIYITETELQWLALQQYSLCLYLTVSTRRLFGNGLPFVLYISSNFCVHSKVACAIIGRSFIDLIY